MLELWQCIGLVQTISKLIFTEWFPNLELKWPNALYGTKKMIHHHENMPPPLTHWGWDKVAVILQRTFANSWIKIIVFRF